MNRSASNRLHNNTRPATPTLTSNTHHYFRKGGIVEEKKQGFPSFSTSSKLPGFGVDDVKSHDSCDDDGDDALLMSATNDTLNRNDYSMVGPGVGEECSIGNRSALTTTTSRRHNVSFAPSVCVYEHGLEIGNFQLCNPMIFYDRPFCRSGLPVQLSNQLMATYTEPLEQTGGRIAFPQSLRDQERRLLTIMGYSRGDVKQRMAWFERSSTAGRERVVVLDDSDREAVLFCDDRESDAAFIHSEHIPSMFLQGVEQYFSGENAREGVALANWYRLCQSAYGAEHASAVAHHRAVCLQLSLETPVMVRCTADGKVETGPAAETSSGRKRSFTMNEDET